MANYLLGGPSMASVLLDTTTQGSTPPSFSSPTTFPTGPGPYAIVSSDFNGDGRPDFAVSNYTTGVNSSTPSQNAHSVSVLMNRTSMGASVPSFRAKHDFATGANPDAVAIGDLDADGKPDLAIANLGESSISVLLNTTEARAATAAFATAASVATGDQPYSIAAADINNDGKDDLAATSLNGGYVAVLLTR